MFSWLEARVWQVGTFAAVAVAVSLGAALLWERAEAARLEDRVAVLTRKIEDPDTGYVARLSQCRTNGATLQATLDQQNERFRRLSADSARRLAATETELSRSRAETARLVARAAGTLAWEPPGADSCARMDAVRRRYLEGLRP